MSAWFLAWPAAGLISFACGPQVHRWSQQIAHKPMSLETEGNAEIE